MANQTVSIDLKQLKQMASSVEAIDVYREKLEELKKNFFLSVPEKLAERIFPKGSSLWWEWSDTLAQEDIKKGKYKSFDSPERLFKWLDS